MFSIVQNENSAFESDEWNLVKSVTPLIFSDLAGVTNRGVENRENTKRSICSKKWNYWIWIDL